MARFQFCKKYLIVHNLRNQTVCKNELNVWAIVSSLNQTSNFSSNSQMAVYLESLSSMIHFPFNHVKELDLSHNCAKRKVEAWGRFFLQ